MLYEIMLSLRLHLSEQIPELTDVQFMYDGVELSGKQKPFVTIEDLPSPTLPLSAGRVSFQDTYVFQVGVFADSYTERVKLQAEVKEVLQRKIPLYDESNEQTGLMFQCDVSSFTPISNDDTAHDTFNFRGYYDVSVTMHRKLGTKVFTQ